MAHNDYRKVMRLDPGDEKRELLAEKGIFFLDEIDENNAYVIFLEVIYLHLINFNSPIWIILNSPGGDAASGLAIIDTIRALVKKGRVVNILGVGEVASMATAVMQAATKRYCLPNTQFLVHQVRQTLPFFKQEEVNEGRERVAEMDRINDIVMGIIAHRSGIELDEIKKLSDKKDYWMDASKALKFGTHGLIDEVITELPF